MRSYLLYFVALAATEVEKTLLYIYDMYMKKPHQKKPLYYFSVTFIEKKTASENPPTEN